MSLDEIDKPGKPLLCLEVNPPRGTSLESIFKRLDGRLEGVDLLNVTDSALARMKMAAIPFACFLKERYGIEPLVNMSCRDRNLIGVQGDLLAGWVSGIRSIIALTGDAVTVGDSPERKGVFEVNSVGLLNTIYTLNDGKDLAGNKLKGAPDYYPGVVVNPNARNPKAEIKKLVRKKDAGARYALSQPVFDLELSVEFFAAASEVEIPLFIGLLPISKGSAALGINSIPGIRLSDDLLKQAEADPSCDLKEQSIAQCIALAEANMPYVRGFHVISGGAPKLALTLVERLVTFINSL